MYILLLCILSFILCYFENITILFEKKKKNYRDTHRAFILHNL